MYPWRTIKQPPEGGATFPPVLSTPQKERRLVSAQTQSSKGQLKDRDITGLNRFPFNNFTYYLTLFSKFFSSFPHGTCSLSVSCLYLALDEMYHPFWTAFPNNPTLGAAFILTTRDDPDGNVTLFVVPFQRTLTISRHQKVTLSITIRTPIRMPDFKFELFPLRSPLLGESLLVSFPPLTDMLKFSGYPYLI